MSRTLLAIILLLRKKQRLGMVHGRKDTNRLFETTKMILSTFQRR